MRKRLYLWAAFCLMPAFAVGPATVGCGHNDAGKVTASGKPSSPAELDHMSLEELKRLDQNPTLSPIEKMVIETKIRRRQEPTGAPSQPPSTSAGR